MEASGLTPLWREDTSGSSLQRMQYTWATGTASALDSRTIPGAVYLGQNGSGTDSVEQQLNNFKGSAAEPLPNTIEFDVRNPISGVARLSLRPRRRGDMATLRMAQSGDATRIEYRFPSPTSVSYDEKTGPSHGWTHVTVSYRQFVSAGVTRAHYVIAFNEEVREVQADSGIVNPDWETHWSSDPAAEGWSIESYSAMNPMGKWIANVRVYDEFLTRDEMSTRLAGRVGNYRSALPDPAQYAGPSKRFVLDQPLVQQGLNPVAYAEVLDDGSVRLDGSLSSSWKKIQSYTWSFGDGTSGTGRTVTHRYEAPGTYTASLTIANEYGASTRQVAVTVTAAPDPGSNTAPDAVADAVSTLEDNAVSVDVLGNDTDADGDSLAITTFTQGSRGTVSLDGSRLTYSPHPNAHGTDTFTYTVADGRGGTDTAPVTATVTPVNDPPSVTHPGNQAGVEGDDVSLLVRGADPDGDALTYQASGLPPGLAIDGATGEVAGRLSGGASAGSPYSVEVTATDAAGTSATAGFVWAVAAATRPAVPAALSARPTSVSVDLDWSDGEAGVAGYNVYRAQDVGGPYSKLTDTAVTTSRFSDRTAPLGSILHYRVTAISDRGLESDPAAVAAARVFAFVGASGASVPAKSPPSIPIARPAGVNQGDVMLAAVSVAGTPNITAPEGWRLLVTNSAGTKLRQSVFLRTVTSNEPSSYTWTLSAKTAASISLVAYRSPALAGAGEIVAGQANSSSATITAPSVATPASDALYVGFYGVAANATIVPPPGMIEQAEVQSPNGGKVAVEAADEILASAGTVGERRATAAAPGVNIGQVVVLVPSGP